MRKVKILFINVIILTATSLLMRTIGISYQVYLSNTIGSAGIGLFQLIMSIYYLSITISISGIRLAVTRLVAEELGLNRPYGAIKALRSCLVYSIIFSSISATLLYLNAPFIGANWLCDVRTVLSLRLLAISLPFIAMSAVFNGYFTAVRRAVKAASVQFIEQLIKISVTVGCLAIFLPWGLEYACVAIVVGICVGEIASFLLLLLMVKLDSRRYKNGHHVAQSMVPRMLHIALPVALSAYISSSIRTAQNLLVPFGLKQHGASSENALATYGVINGMVMPVLMFPSVLLDAISDLIVPELAECQACNGKKRLNYIVNRIFKFGMLTSIGVMCIFLSFSDALGLAIYNSKEAAYFIRLLAPIIPIMYLDTIVDSMLKGIGQQISAMRYNIIESCLSVGLIYVLLPHYGIMGYTAIIFFGRILNFSLSVRRLMIITDLKIDLMQLLKALGCIISALILSDLFFNTIHILFYTNKPPLLLPISLVTLFYFVLLRLVTCITYDDLLWVKTLFK
ncbi:MAG: oligosaccharide flippase family protein [Hyphomonadaceae bacterium]|nr:oligosaccharide flippase family protein [Clostridia bacterium]